MFDGLRLSNASTNPGPAPARDMFSGLRLETPMPASPATERDAGMGHAVQRYARALRAVPRRTVGRK